MWVSHGIHAHVGKGKDLIGLTVTAVRLDRKSLPTLLELFWHFRGPNGSNERLRVPKCVIVSLATKKGIKLDKKSVKTRTKSSRNREYSCVCFMLNLCIVFSP